MELMIAFGMPKLVVMDNEKVLNSATIKFLLQDQLQATVYTTPPYSSISNVQVKRLHSILTEIMRCLRRDSSTSTFEEIIFKAVQEYNASIHSTRKTKPIDIFFGHRQIIDLQILDVKMSLKILKINRKRLSYTITKRNPP